MAHILAVDDEELIRKVLQTLLASAGHTVTTASDGQTALESIRTAKPDLVISDIRMFPMNGMELLREIRKEWRDLPVLMITAFATEDTIEESKNLGVVGYLSKPFTNEEVFRVISLALEMPRAAVDSSALRKLADGYMRKEHLPTVFEAKATLADQLYWLSLKHPNEQLAAALKEAMGTDDIPIEYVSGLLHFRETMVRVKNLMSTMALGTGRTPTELLLELSAKVSKAYDESSGDMEAALSSSCEILGLPQGSLTVDDVEFMREFREDSPGQDSSGDRT